MTEPDARTRDTELHAFEVRETARREAFRLARDHGAPLVTRPLLRSQKETTVTDVEPLAGARAARDLEAAARGTARDYIRQARQAREAGQGWEQIGRALGLDHGGNAQGEATPADAAFAYAAGGREPGPPWQPKFFAWTCRTCDHHIADVGLVAGPADDETGHTGDCARHAAAIADWDAQAARWDADSEAGQ